MRPVILISLIILIVALGVFRPSGPTVITTVYAQPPGIPMAIYGTVTLNGNAAPGSLTVIAKVSGQVRGTSTISNGNYLLTVQGSNGETINFYLNNVASSQTATFNTSTGGVLELNLAFTDNTPPSAPQNFQVAGYVNPSTPILSWTASTDDTAVQYYVVNIDSGSDQNVGNVTQWTVSSSLTLGSHQLNVKAVDVVGNQGAYSTLAIVITTTVSTSQTSVTSQTTSQSTSQTGTTSQTSSQTTSQTATSSQTTSQTTGTAGADFSLTASASKLNLAPSSQGTVLLTIQSIGSFSSSVQLSTGSLPDGLGVFFAPNPVTPSPGSSSTSTATFLVVRAAQGGIWVITIIGTSGSMVKHVDITIQISSSGCLIATATFGSELSPEVQFLRGFRDQQILMTFAGENFMKAFNAWYYSFSPSVANSIAGEQTLRAGMKLSMYPLIGALRISSTVFQLLDFNPELAAFISGIVASVVIGLAYLAGPTSAVLWIFRRSVDRKEISRIAKWLGLQLAVLTVGFLISETFALSTVMITVATTTVLTGIATGTMLPTFMIFLWKRREHTSVLRTH